jgi:hypothetical protein
MRVTKGRFLAETLALLIGLSAGATAAAALLEMTGVPDYWQGVGTAWVSLLTGSWLYEHVRAQFRRRQAKAATEALKVWPDHPNTPRRGRYWL